jgi:hypothetical protein
VRSLAGAARNAAPRAAAAQNQAVTAFLHICETDCVAGHIGYEL